MVCCQYDSPQLVPEPGGIVARVVVVGERTFLPLSLQKAQAAVTAFDAEMESGKNIIEDIITLALSSVYISSSSLLITGIAWSAAAHPALLFCLILIRDGNSCVVPLVPQHLGSAPHSILGL